MKHYYVYRSSISMYFTLFINHVGSTWLLGLPRKQNGHPVECITHQMFISPPLRGIQHLWRLTYDLLMVAKLAGPLMGVKDTSKLQNRRVAKLYIVVVLLCLIFVNYFIPRQLSHGSRYCFINNTNELCLLISSAFWRKKKRRDDKWIWKRYTTVLN